MQALQFNVAQLLKEPIGSTRLYDLDDDVSALTDEIRLVGPVKGRLKFTRTDEGILVEGDMSAAASTECRRCAGAYVTKLDVMVQELFLMTHDVESGAAIDLGERYVDEATLIDARHMLDLSEVLRQQIILSMPIFPLCRPDCAGLCPHCGQDLNTGPCDCKQEEIHPQWEALQSLLDSTEN